MTPYHKWLIRQRVYCQGGDDDINNLCMRRATTVVNRDGKDFVYCDEHCSKSDYPHLSDPMNTQPENLPVPVLAEPVNSLNVSKSGEAIEGTNNETARLPRTISDSIGGQTFPTLEEQQSYWQDREQDMMSDPANGFVQWCEEIDRKLPF